MTDTHNDTADTAPLPAQVASEPAAPDATDAQTAPLPMAGEPAVAPAPAPGGRTVTVPARTLAIVGGILLVLVLMAGSFGAGIIAGRHSVGGFRRGAMMQQYGFGQGRGQGRMMPFGQGQGQGQGQLPYGHPRGFGGRGGQNGWGDGTGPQGMPWPQQTPDATATPQ